MPIVTNPISTQPYGAVTTNAALAAISVVTTTENSVVTTLGGNTVGDGNGGIYFFQAASTRPIDNVLVLGTPTTGRWINANAATIFSGVGPLTASQTGLSETFVLLSGFAPIVYTLPPSTNVLGEIVTVRTQTTGTATVRTSGDLLFTTSKTSPNLSVASVTSTLTGGYVWNFRATSGAYYQVDQFNGGL